MDDDWVKVMPGRRSLSFKTNPVLQQKVPDVIGMTLRDALYILGNQHLNVKIEGSGKRVLKQSMAPGTDIDKEKTIIITLS
ncbi:MAG: PASTA domain-containing protein, partial [Pontibacter sp.]|nr:PASTA domain-containing protein [Pontibacter sp.]